MGLIEERMAVFSKQFLETVSNKEILVVSHFDTDGITSAAIVVKALKRKDCKFSVKIVKTFGKDVIEALPKDKILLLLDLGSSHLLDLASSEIEHIFIIDHHGVASNVPESLHFFNPEVLDQTQMSASGLAFFFVKEMDDKNADLIKFGILGMIGDTLEKEISLFGEKILKEENVQEKRGLLLYPSTRSLDKVLEYSSQPFIPGVTGDPAGVIQFLDENGFVKNNGMYKSINELTEEDAEKLMKSILLKNPGITKEFLMGEIYLLRWYGKMEDARELSARINACSRLDRVYLSLQLCLEIPSAKKEAESMHAKYKRNILSSLKELKDSVEFSGKGFIVMNAKDKVKDTFISTTLNILSRSGSYQEETILVGLAFSGDKIRVSVRNTEQEGRNVKEIFQKIIDVVGGEVRGHRMAAGCIIQRKDEKEFLELTKRELEIETVKVR